MFTASFFYLVWFSNVSLRINEVEFSIAEKELRLFKICESEKYKAKKSRFLEMEM